MTPDDEQDPLTHFTHRLRDHAEEVHAGRVPDFAAMMARARELDADAVSAASAAEAEALAPVIPIQRSHHERHDEDVLAPFTAATRAELAFRPAPTRTPVAPAEPARRRVALFVGLAAAAAILLLAQAPQRVARLLAPTNTAVEALADGASEPEHRTARPAPQPRASERPVLQDTPATPEPATPEPAIVEPATPEPPATNLDTTPDPRPTPAPTRSPRRPAPAPTTPLEDEAQALWQRGELAAAEQKFREVVRIAGKSARAELAYGDLFALAGQIRGTDGEVALAREYLAAFPRGRFADDMRAGLCRRAAADARPACWRDYLERHPEGAHRRAAEAALADGPPL